MGYDRTWRELSKNFRVEHPFCECDEHKGKDIRYRAQVVDHIIPIAERPDLRLDLGNLRSMAKRCHDRHTARTRGFGRSHKG